MTARAPLAELLANRRWVRTAAPFPHVVARDVFTASAYAELAAEFGRIERDHPEAFDRNMGAYDATAASVDHYRDGPLGVFVSRPWHDLMAGLFGVTATGDMTASLHHHEPGGRSGWPHNDLNPGWFAADPAAADDVRLSCDGEVNYHHGTRPDGVAARETVRAVAALFYLGNPGWQPGDGGETGLFAEPADRIPAATVAPIDNSLVAFECTPYTWHGYLANKSKPRNCVVMWVHRDKAEAVRRWGASSIAYW